MSVSDGLWSNLAAVVGTPVGVWLIAAGYGLSIERLLRMRVSNPVLVGLGFCGATVISLAVFELGVGDAVAVPVVLVPAVVGLVLCGRHLPSRLNAGWPLVAALATYILFDVSVIASGHWTLTFYNVDNDSAYELVLITHLQAHGTAHAVGAPSTAKSVVDAYLATGYPLGGQSFLAITSGLLRVPGAVVWQGFMSVTVAIGVMVTSTLSGRTMSPAARSVAAFIAGAAALTFQFALQGSIKELVTLTATLTALAVMREGLVGGGRRFVIAAAVPLAAVLAAFNAAGVPYVGALLGSGVLVLLLIDLPRRPSLAPGWWRPFVISGATLFVLALPALVTLATFLSVATAGYSGSHPGAPVLGPLLRPLPLSEAVGVWLYGDYRLPVPAGAAGQLTLVLTLVILALGVIGIGRTAAAREPGPLMGLLTMGLVLLIIYPRITPYAQAKLLAIASPLVVLAALQGLTGLRRRLPRILAVSGGVAIAAGVLWSDALAYHEAPTLPTDRMLALAQIGQRMSARVPILDSEFEQFAKVMTYPAALDVGPDNPTPRRLVLTTKTGEYDRSFDLNQQTLRSVESYPEVLVRRSPVASPPPANYRFVSANAFYELWKRAATPSVLAHLPVSDGELGPPRRPDCRRLRELVDRAPASARLVAATLPPTVGFTVAGAAIRPHQWIPDTYHLGAFITATPGNSESPVTVSRSGRYRLWIQGNLPRAVSVAIDGRMIGSAQGTDAPGGWRSAGTATILAGRHRLGLERGGGGLGPGNGNSNATLSAVALVPAGATPARVTYGLRAWRELCRAQAVSWIEVVRR